MAWLRRASRLVNRWMLRAASATLLVTMGIAVANMVLRPLGRPVQGSFELMGFGGALIAAFALGYTQERRNHISVDIVFERFGPRLQGALGGVSHLVCAAFFGLAGYRIGRLGLDLMGTGEVSETLRVAFHPIVFCVALGLWGLCFGLVLDGIGALRGEREEG
ncbi:MAG: TRAP transporter small permease [Thermodesulfobacteriota bacterium]|jgi:TRAP-type C4-dicarboxylate transport system permease small subunit